MKLATLQLRHCVVRSRGYRPPLGRFIDFAFSSLRVVSQKSAIHELIHRTLALLGDLLNALAKTPQDNDLRLSSGLFLSGLKIDKFDGIQVDP